MYKPFQEAAIFVVFRIVSKQNDFQIIKNCSKSQANNVHMR